MILDYLTMFDVASAITAARASTNTIDLGCQRDLGVGEEPPAITVTAVSAFAGPANATLQVQVQSSVDNVSWSTLVETAALPVASLTTGQVLLRGLLPTDQPAATSGVGRYLRLDYVVVNGPFTAGEVTAGLVPLAQSWGACASATTSGG